MQGDGPGLAVGDAGPLAHDAVVLAAKTQRDLERAIGIDEHNVGRRTLSADALDTQPGGRGAVVVRDPQRRGPGRFLVVGGIRQRIERRGDFGREPAHMRFDVRTEPGLA